MRSVNLPLPFVPAARLACAWRALTWRRLLPWCAVAALWLCGVGVPVWAGATHSAAQTADVSDSGHAQVHAQVHDQVQDLARQSVAVLAGDSAWRVELEVGRLDAHLKLAPCSQIVPSLAAGVALWGRTRVALHCAQGPVRWRAWLPVHVRVFGPGWVTAAALAEGTLLQGQHLHQQEVEYTAQAAPRGLKDSAPAQAWLGRALARPIGAGMPVRESDLRQRVWFQGGELVRVLAVGEGYVVATEGRAEGQGVEGRLVRVRTDNGRVLEGRAVGPRRVEILL